MVRRHEVPPRELVQLCLDRIDRIDPQLNSFHKVLGAGVAEAEQAEARLKAGGRAAAARGAIAIKNESVVGGVTTHGTILSHRACYGRLRWCDGCARRARSSSG
jgi:Asp-tRNA(Asn)/Glu-tRNA(Gln) amidotransferase A subunit family amidase